MRHILSKLPATLALSCLLATHVTATPGRSSGTTYYLDADAGDDQHVGFPAGQAWKTLERANQFQFQPGDSLRLKAGTRYRGQLKLQGSGQAAAPGEVSQTIVIGKYGDGPAPRIDAEGKFTAALELFNVQGYEVSDLDLTNDDPEKKPRHWGAYVHLEDFGRAAHIRLTRLHIHDVHGTPYKDDGPGGAIVWSNAGKNKPTFFDGLIIEACHIENCERDGIRGRDIDTSRNNWHPSLNVVIRKNLIERIPGDAIVVVGCDGALVEHNLCRDFVRPPGLGTERGTVSAGIWPWSSDNTLIQFNEVSGHKAQQDGQGFDADWNCRNTVFQYNYSHDNEGGFMLFCNPGAIKMPKNAGSVGTIVRYNVSVNDGIRAVGKTVNHAPIFHFGGSATKTRIYNNTIIVPAKASPKIDNSIVHCSPWQGGMADDILFANNIIQVSGSANYVWGTEKLAATHVRFDGNLLVGTHRGVQEDPHAVTGDPRFVNLHSPGNGRESVLGLKLQAHSPAIGKGIPLLLSGTPFQDFAGVIVAADRPPTLGAFESITSE